MSGEIRLKKANLFRLIDCQKGKLSFLKQEIPIFVVCQQK